MKYRRVPSTLWAVMILFAAPAATAVDDPLPWTLRDHYSFTGQKSSFSFDVKTAEWKLEVEGLGAILKNVKAEIELADGTRLSLSEMTHQGDTRERVTGPMGDGTKFGTSFAHENGLLVRCSITTFKEAPFLILHLEAKNTGKNPIQIAAIRPIVITPNGVAARKVKVTRLQTSNRANFPVYHGNGQASLYQIHISKPKISIGLGILQTGATDSHIDIQPAGESWQGSVECRFDPPVTVARGKTLEADPVWISYGVLKADQVQEFYAWAQSTLPGARQTNTMPGSWVALQEGLSPDEIRQVAKLWGDTTVQHVLAPLTQVSQSQAIEDAEPLQPRTAKRYIQEIARMGMKPGLTLDPLQSDTKKGNWSVADDTDFWLDPTHEKAKAYTQQRIDKLLRWGVQFIVIPPSTIPDHVLTRFELTRKQADALAFQLVIQAAGAIPVMPTPAQTLGDEVAQWQQAALSTRYLKVYGIAAGPVRLDVSAIHKWNDKLSKAILEFDGPIEIIGTPAKGLRKDLFNLMKLKAEIARHTNPQSAAR